MEAIEILIPNAGQLQTHVCVSGVLWVALILVILLDLWDRCYTERRLKRRLRSHKFRDTMQKIAEYWRFMVVAFVIDLALIVSFEPVALPYVGGALFIGLACIELKSMWEHACERKSGATQLSDVLKMLIDCATEADAKAALKKVGDYLDKKGPEGKTNAG